MRGVVTSGLAVCAAALLLTPGTAGAASQGAQGPVRLPTVQLPRSWYEPTPIRDKPSWLPEGLGEDSTVLLIPGTSDFTPISSTAIGGAGSPMGGDQYGRTVDVGFYDAPHGAGSYNPKIPVVQYPAAFGVVVGNKKFDLTGNGTYNDSVDIGTADGVADAERAWVDRGKSGTIVLNGYSQSGPIAMNVAYKLHQKYLAGDADAIPDANVVVVVGADSRFPNTGIETVIPSVIPGAYTNGPRDESSTGDIRVISYCVRGDSVCGLGNPLAHPLTSAFYFLPGATIHGQKGNLVNQYRVVSTKEVGATTYVVLDGGNPQGIFLRSLGIPVPPEFDDALDTLVPYRSRVRRRRMQARSCRHRARSRLLCTTHWGCRYRSPTPTPSRHRARRGSRRRTPVRRRPLLSQPLTSSPQSPTPRPQRSPRTPSATWSPI